MMITDAAFSIGFTLMSQHLENVSSATSCQRCDPLPLLGWGERGDVRERGPGASALHEWCHQAVSPCLLSTACCMSLAGWQGSSVECGEDCGAWAQGALCRARGSPRGVSGAEGLRAQPVVPRHHQGGVLSPLSPDWAPPVSFLLLLISLHRSLLSLFSFSSSISPSVALCGHLSALLSFPLTTFFSKSSWP